MRKRQSRKQTANYRTRWRRNFLFIFCFAFCAHVERHPLVNLYFCLPDRCRQKIHKSKGDRQCKNDKKKISVPFALMCFLCALVRQTDRGINAPYQFNFLKDRGNGCMRVSMALPTNVCRRFSSHWPSCYWGTSSSSCIPRTNNKETYLHVSWCKRLGRTNGTVSARLVSWK